MNIRELEQRTGSNARQIRALIAEGFLHAPRGPRSQPEYGDDHVLAVVRYQRLRGNGLTPKVIHALMRPLPGATVSVTVCPGLTLHIDPALLDDALDHDAVGEQVADILGRYNTKPIKNHQNGVDDVQT